MQMYFSVVFWLSLAGVLFSGYLAGARFFSHSCAFNEPCPTFLGYPACYFGFGMFLAIFVFSLIGVKTSSDVWVYGNLAISVLGSVFAAYFTIPEIKLLFSGQTNYSLGLPTCSYGLVFYLAVFIYTAIFIARSGFLPKF